MITITNKNKPTIYNSDLLAILHDGISQFKQRNCANVNYCCKMCLHHLACGDAERAARYLIIQIANESVQN